MGVWSTIKQALGLETTPEIRPLEPLALSPGGERRLASLPAGVGLRLELHPVRAGWVLQVHEEPVSDEAAHPDFEGLPIAASDADLARLRGLELDAHDGRWRLRAEVTVRARETPNPDGRLYLTDRRLADGRLFFPASAVGAPWLVGQLLERDDVRSVLVRDHTLSIERAPGAPWDAIDRAVAHAVREHVMSAADALSPADVPDRDDPLEAAVWRILEHRVLPGIHADGGDLKLVGVYDGVVKVDLVGACRTCPASVLTLKGGIERVLKEELPGEIDRVEPVD